MKNRKPIENYVRWCELMGLKPSLVENICRYKRLCEKMNQPKWKFKFTLPNGKVKSFTTADYPYGQVPQLLTECVCRNIDLEIFRINPDQTMTRIHDTRSIEVVEAEDALYA